jgi:ubiquinone/menaquinone biosynthesis C-methylase UbiE
MIDENMTSDDRSTTNEEVRSYWESQPCGTEQKITGDATSASYEFFERVEKYRYRVEPFIHSVAQFTRHHGKTFLEVGVGAGTDHLQWARAGLKCHGVDLTDAAVELTRQRLALYGFTSSLQRADAEALPFPDNSFDLVYSWGVIHHSQAPQKVIEEIRRVLKPGGLFIGMLYGRRSLKVLKTWIWFALLRGRVWMSFREVVSKFVESPGTKSYTQKEIKKLFSDYASVETMPYLTIYDKRAIPEWICAFIPDKLGWFIAIHARK